MIAANPSVGWISSSPAAVSFTKQPSATQLCTDPPTLEATASTRYSRKLLRKGKWGAKLKLRSSGIGTAELTLIGPPVPPKATVKPKRRKTKRAKQAARVKKAAPVTLLTVATSFAKPGDVTLTLRLPVAARKLGTYTIRVVTTAPDGKTQATNTLKLEVRK